MKIVQHSQKNSTLLTDKLNELNTDLAALVRLVEYLTGFPFAETRAGVEYRATHSGLRCSMPHGYNTPKFYDESCKTTYTNADGYTFKKLFYLHTDGKEYGQKVDILYNLGFIGLAECSQMLPNYTPKQTPTHTPIQAQTVAKPAKATNTTLEFFATGWDTPHGQNTLQHLQTKTGAGEELLARYVVPICRKVVTKADGKINAFDCIGDNFAFGYMGVGKYKQPRQIKYKYQYGKEYDNTKPYRFGFDQLPKDGTGKTCVICAGEDDAICINACGNAYGFFAICFSSESKPYDQPTLDELRARGFDLLAFFDRDKTGRERVAQYAPLAGLPYVDIDLLWQYLGAPLEYKDVCDLYKFGGFATVVGALEFAQATNGKKDVAGAGVDIPHCYTLPFTQYLGERFEQGGTLIKNTYINAPKFIESAMLVNSKLSVISQAGTGKTTMLQSIFDSQTILDKYGKRFYILLVPTTSIADQQAHEFNQVLGAGRVIVVHGKTDKKDVTELLDTGANVIICVYDSFPLLCGIGKGKKKHLADILHSSYVVVDEYHLLVTAANYRDTDALNHIQKNVVENNNVPCLTLTGTPVLYANVARTQNTDGTHTDTHLFKHIFCTPQIQSKIRCTIVTHSLKRSAVAAWIEDTTPVNSKGTTLVKWDNTTYNNKITELWNARGLRVDSINSKRSEHKEKNETYNGILQNGLFARPLDFLFFTKIFEVGVSIRDEVRAFYTIDTTDFREIIQLANRPRMQQGGANSLIDLYVLIRAKENTDKDVTDGFDAVALVNKMWHEASTLAAQFNAAECPTDEYRLHRKNAIANKSTSTDAQIFVYPTHTPNGTEYHVNTLAILNRVQQLENSNVTPETLAKRLALDTRFEFQPTLQALEIGEDATLQAEILAVKDEQTAQMKRFDQLLLDTNTQKQLLECVAHICKNTDLKEQIRDVFHLPKWSMDTNKDFLETEIDALHSKGAQYKINKALEMTRAGVDKDKALQAVATSNKSELIRDVHALIQQDRKARLTNAKKSNAKRTDGTITTHGLEHSTVYQCERIRACYEFGLLQFVKDVARGKTKNEFTAQRILDITNKALDKANQTANKKYKAFDTTKQALTVLTDFYNLLEPKQVRDGKKRGARVYGFDLANLKRTF